MKFKFLGTRGSYPTSNIENKKYGGSTPCIEVKHRKQRIILDAGTGIMGLNFKKYFKSERIDILLSHLHMDHIQGLGFFKPLFIPNKEVHIWGPGGSSDSLHTRLNRFLSPPLFPLPLRDLPCDLHIHEITNSQFSIGDFKIKSEFIIHPGPTIGYRVENDSKVLTYIPDHEPMIGSMDLYKENKWVSGYYLCKEADALIHDAQYTVEEYQTRIGWGHSTTKHVIDLAKRANVKNLFMFHHDPEHSDLFLKKMLDGVEAQEGLDIYLATQGKEIKLK